MTTDADIDRVYRDALARVFTARKCLYGCIISTNKIKLVQCAQEHSRKPYTLLQLCQYRIAGAVQGFIPHPTQGDARFQDVHCDRQTARRAARAFLELLPRSLALDTFYRFIASRRIETLRITRITRIGGKNTDHVIKWHVFRAPRDNDCLLTRTTCDMCDSFLPQDETWKGALCTGCRAYMDGPYGYKFSR